MINKKKIIVIVVAYNEQGKIGSTVSKIKKFASSVDLILAVDDGSTDKTASEAKANGAKVIKHSKNKGVGKAIKTGIKFAIDKKFDICVVTGGDDQDDKKDILNLVKPIIEDNYDLVLASRYLGSTKDMNLFRALSTKMFTALFNFTSGSTLTDASNGFRAFKTEIAKKINIWQDWLNNYEMEPYFLYHAARKYKVKEIPTFKTFDHKKGYSKMKPFISWWKITKPLIYLKLGLKK